MIDERDIWQVLDEAPDGCEAVSDLYHWSTNYQAGEGPFTLFLDMIGWSDEQFGERIYSGWSLGYVELDKLGLALREYADRPQAAREYVDLLMEAEAR